MPNVQYYLEFVYKRSLRAYALLIFVYLTFSLDYLGIDLPLLVRCSPILISILFKKTSNLIKKIQVTRNKICILVIVFLVIIWKITVLTELPLSHPNVL